MLVPMLVCGAASAWAGLPGLELTWEAPPICPQVEDVERTLGPLLDGVTSVRQHASVRVSGDDRHWSATLSSGDAQRQLTGSTCDGVAHAAMVVLVMMVDPTLAVQVPTSITPQPTREWSLGVAGLFDMLTTLAPGLALNASIELTSRFFGELSLNGFLPQSRTVTAEGVGASFRWVTATTAIRWNARFDSLTLSPVLGVESGALLAQSFGVSNPASNAAFWASVHAGGGASFAWRRLRFWLRVEFMLAVTRPRFVIAGVGEIPTPTPLLRFTFGGEFVFPPREEARE